MDRRGHVGPEWARAITTLSMVVTFVVVVAALYWAQSIFMPVALAVLLTFILGPAVTWLQRHRVGRTASVAIVMGLTLTVFAVVGVLVAQQMARLGQTLPDHGPNIVNKVEAA